MLHLLLSASLMIATGAPSAEPANSSQAAPTSTEASKPKRKCMLVEVMGSSIPRRVCKTVKPKKPAEPAPTEEAEVAAGNAGASQAE